MANASTPSPKLDRYVVIHVATTCDEHGVYVTKDSAEVIEIGWILLDTKTCDEVRRPKIPEKCRCACADADRTVHSYTGRVFSSSQSTRPSHPCAVSRYPSHCFSALLLRPFDWCLTSVASLTTLTWEHVRNAGTFRDAIGRFNDFVEEHLISKGQEFSFVTLDAWDLRVQLPREARDKSVVLPPYLQHSRTYDLRSEYTKWQQRHPESLPFGPSSLTNICAALEVDPVQSSAPIKHNLPFHLQALAPASPRRAMEEAITLARVLHGLIRKSQPQHEHAEILRRPMDAKADVQAFLGERSKVLHMNGLPHDTTQSELESWFTQYGGRPIAFWTLRTPDQHKPTGSGFAVFSSHEEVSDITTANSLTDLVGCGESVYEWSSSE